MKERYEPQLLEEDSWCGPAALRHALHKQGVDVSQGELAAKLKTDLRWGTHRRNLTLVAIEYCGNVRAQEAFTLSLLEEYLDQGYSVIANVMSGPDEFNDGHYLTIEMVDDEAVIVFDPEEGTEAYDRDEFLARWYDFDERGERLSRWALVFRRSR